MSKQETYTCDLCDEPKGIDRLFGVYFTSAGCWEVRPSRDCVRHVCVSCVARIRTAADFQGVEERHDLGLRA